MAQVRVLVRFMSLLLAVSTYVEHAQAAPAILDMPVSITGTALARYRDMDLDALFKAVAEDVHYEPYSGILRGAGGTAVARAGNDADQALLLATLLRTRGYRVRFAIGTLSDGNIDALIMGTYPPDLPQYIWPAEIETYAPRADKALRAIAAKHIWLELDQGEGSWLPLDPSFPRAKIGEAYATAAEHYDALPDTLSHRISVKLFEKLASGSVRELGGFDRKVTNVALAPLGLTIIGIPQVKKAEDKPAANPAGLFGGSLAGGSAPKQAEAEKPDAAKPVATLYRRQLRIGDETVSWAGSLTLNAKPESALKREWLEITITSPDGAQKTVERDLFADDAPGLSDPHPAAYRHYEIAVLPGLLPLADIRQHLDSVKQRIDLAAVKDELGKLDQKAPDALEKLTAYDSALTALNGHLAAMAFAAEADSLTTQLAYTNGITVAYSRPRVIILSVEGREGTPMAFRTSLDLRLDEVDARPFPGNAVRAAHNFQEARGMQDSMIEGRFMERILGLKQAASTMNLMELVAGGPEGLLSFSPGQEGELAKVPGLSAYAHSLISRSLANGRDVVIPAQPVMLAGRSRYGWWEKDPMSGRMIGIMDDGLHQAMVDYSLNVENLGLNNEEGRAIGVMVGAASTQILLASGILEYGAITEKLLKDIEKTITQLKCLACPEVSAKIGEKTQIGDSCFADSRTAGRAYSGIGFCQKFTDGFGCAASLIVHGLRVRMGTQKKSIVGITASAEIKAACASVKVE